VASRLLRAVLADQEWLRRLIAEAVGAQVPSARAAATDRVAGTIDAAIRAIPRAGGARAAGGPRLRAVGVSYSRAARPVTDLLAAQRIQYQVIVDHVRRTGSRLGSPASDVLATIDILGAASNAVSAQLATAYRDAEPRQHTADRERAEFVRDLLWATPDAAWLAPAAMMHAVDIDREYLALRARPEPGHGVDELAGALGLRHGRSNGGGLSAVVNGDLVGFVTSPPKGPVLGVAGLGPARPLALLHESFRMATRALHTADRRSMTGVCEFGRLGLLPGILSDKATGAALCDRFFTPLGDNEFAVEIIETLRAYLSCGMQAPRAAQLLCVHPNTVRYRIAKFEELTGVSFRGNRTASFEVLWALEHRADARHLAGRRSRPRPVAERRQPAP
jgi:hypothetical protein